MKICVLNDAFTISTCTLISVKTERAIYIIIEEKEIESTKKKHLLDKNLLNSVSQILWYPHWNIFCEIKHVINLPISTKTFKINFEELEMLQWSTYEGNQQGAKYSVRRKPPSTPKCPMRIFPPPCAPKRWLKSGSLTKSCNQVLYLSF